MSEVPLYQEVVRACASFLLCEGRGGGGESERERAKPRKKARECGRQNVLEHVELSRSLR